MSIGLWITVILSAWLILGFLAARLYVWHNKGIETPAHTVRKEVYDAESGYYDWKDVEVPAVYITPADCLALTLWGALGFVVIVGMGIIIAFRNVINYIESGSFRTNRFVNALFGLKG
jgi:hypothetical protein